MKIHAQLKFADVLALQKNVIHHSQTHRIKKMYFKWILAIVIFLALLFLTGPSLISAFASIIVTIIFIILFPGLYEMATFSQAKRKMAQQDYSAILGDCDFTLNEAGIDRTVNRDTTHFPWSGFIRLGQDETHYFLYQTDLNGLILPKQVESMDASDIIAYQKQIEINVEHRK